MRQQRTRGRKWLGIRARMLSLNPLCVECQRIGVVRAAEQVDHIVPLSQGGTDDDANLQGLCTEHHLRKSTLERGATYRAGCDANGWPLDPEHHWQRPEP
jgi:5-methylcytosine-specific restriction protein A